MKKLSIFKNNQLVQFVNFDDDNVMNEFIAILAQGNSWGKPGEYDVQIEDITAQVEAEKNAHAAKEAVRQARKDARAVLDWSKKMSQDELQAIVKNLADTLDGK